MTFPCIVHLDLKGCPWKLDYLYKVISFMKENGAWGVLIEWEDTFPYTSELVDIGSVGGYNRDGMYSHDEVTQILQFIKKTGMEPIQLIQTIGHMEFVLKHGQYSHLRELLQSPAVLCPSQPGALELVQSIVSQVMEVQPDAAYLHIGADEAWHTNKCSECQQRSKRDEDGAAMLYLGHIESVASYIRAKYPQVVVLMWDDMIRGIEAHLLHKYNLNVLVQPVVWNYNVKDHFKVDSNIWQQYSLTFTKMWAASAYKGANGSSQMLCSAKRYASNQLAWHDEIEALREDVTFFGIILTGWSRFNHYATLCELLPVALPSLASCLRMWTQPDGFNNESLITEQLPLENWWGHEVSSAVMAAFELRKRSLAFLHGDQVLTWLNPWQIEHEYTNPMQVEKIALTAKRFSSEFEWIRRTLSTALLKLTGPRSTEEIIQTWLTPVEKSLTEIETTANGRSQLDPSITPKLTNGSNS